MTISGGIIIIACRDIDAGNQSMLNIKKQIKDATVVVKELDLSSVKSINEFCEDLGE